MYSVIDLSFTIGKKRILKNAKTNFECGKVTAVLGPNGAGKSTLIKCLAGITKPSRGEILLESKQIQQFSFEELAIKRAYLNQHFNLSFDYTVKDLVAMGRFPHYNDIPSSKDEDIIQAALALLGIQTLQNRQTNTLSGGELQRAHFARTLAQIWPSESKDKKLLILDEPVNNLDPQYQHLFLQIAREFAVKHNVAVVVVLHDLNLAAQYAHCSVLMRQGRIVAQGSTREVMTEETLEDVYKIPISVIQNETHFSIITGIKINSDQPIMEPELALT